MLHMVHMFGHHQFASRKNWQHVRCGYKRAVKNFMAGKNNKHQKYRNHANEKKEISTFPDY